MSAHVAALEQRIATLEAEVAVWRAAAVAEDAYANSSAPAGSLMELALYQRLQNAIQQRAPVRAAAILAARVTPSLRAAA
jgi:hypothetical protein